MAGNSTKDRVARAFGHKEDSRGNDDVPSISNADLYIEHEPTVGEFFAEITPSARDVGRYIYNLFPFIHWIGKYNMTWFTGDLVAGMMTMAVFIFGQSLLTRLQA